MYFRLIIFLLGLCCAPRVLAQNTPSDDCTLHTIKPCVTHVAQDEVGIITSPFRITAKDMFWIAPFGVATGFAIDYDAHVMRELGVHPSREDKFKKFSDYAGLYGPSVAPVIGYFVGAGTHNDYLQESSVLAGEATLDAVILNEGLKYAINRETPSQGDETGRFWPHGTRTWPDGQSMPSGHSITAWSFAHVIANRYPSWHTKLLVYGMATTVSVSRVLAREHFPSDVLVGSTLGYLIGGYVAHKRGEVSKKFSFSMVDTPNGRGMQLSYNFNH
jgi:membrane-associated phospholipid phosphatase